MRKHSHRLEVPVHVLLSALGSTSRNAVNKAHNPLSYYILTVGRSTPMASEKLNDFFDKWQTSFPEEGEDCLSDYRLIEIAKQNPDNWPPHVKTCNHCHGVVYLLNATDKPPGEFYENLRTRAKAGLDERPQRLSAPSQLWSFFSMGQPKWAIPALVAALILLFVGWGISSRYISPQNDTHVKISLNEDKYEKTVQWLKISLDKLNDPTLSLREKLVQIQTLSREVPKINERLEGLAKEDMDSNKRAKLANLVTTYNNGLTILQQEVKAQNESLAVNTSKIANTTDSNMVVKIYITAAKPSSSEKSGSENEILTELEEAIAVQAGQDQVSVVGIKENEIEVIDLNLSRSSEETKALQEKIKSSLGGKHVDLKFTKASYKQPVTLGGISDGDKTAATPE